MSQTTQTPVLVYTEATPNPQTLKFVLNKILLNSGHADFTTEEEAQDSPLASELFGFPFVNGVFIANNFVTLTKTDDIDWPEVMGEMRDFIRDYMSEDKPVFTKAYFQKEKVASGEEGSLESKIEGILEKYVKPAVEMDGGAITFQSFDEGIVKLQLKGACSGCPSSMVTLKAGIEGLLKRMVPEVQAVEAEEA